jgi:hypothetical protein
VSFQAVQKPICKAPDIPQYAVEAKRIAGITAELAEPTPLKK